MTDASGGGTRAEPDGYAEMRRQVEDAIAWIDDKLENGRIRDPERARARQGYLRLKIQAIGEWRKLKEAGDLEQLQAEVEELKERHEQGRERVRA